MQILSARVAAVSEGHSWQVKLFVGPARRVKPMGSRGQAVLLQWCPLFSRESQEHEVSALGMIFRDVPFTLQIAPDLPLPLCHLSLSVHCSGSRGLALK